MCLVGYLAGSIPSGVLISKLAGVDDIMSLGSGNTGATNVFRVLGPKYALPVLAIDILKGALPTYFALDMLDMGKAEALAVGVCAILGHNWSVFLRFKGGKGVATTAGAAIVVFPKLLSVGLVVFIIAVAVSRYVSLGSLLGVWTAFGYSLLPGFTPFDRWAVFGLAAVVTYRHRANVQRLLAGKELRLRFGRRGDTG
ncbi:MAG: glycerol-3-phosphate 1-O-acyltransferase PlsY [Firmicutes bacterium]|jgi:glycerol-3-phosphate acyltransferase PlsY|nr:glycerol-3-phosphate 1-O-acyltransferase PlsY [Candidatus Fermentithermobacillaceae bacterium]